MEEQPDGSWRCPICFFALRVCPGCGGLMAKRVVAPEGVGIEAEGLPLDRCQVLWICDDPACDTCLEADL
ncbi:MAG: hypothetical protein JW819_12835 [Candidatus Krumholzibacteriota bacterium]|nr:hypothetical protein [Candidatus Krumholzibacteriota bacterium]